MTSSQLYSRPSGIVRTSQTEIVSPEGHALALRGVGLGNWLLPEGYMWKFGDRTASGRKIERYIRDIAGEKFATRFWNEFRERFIAEADFRRIAELGFDHVRLPLNARFLIGDDGALIEDGFRLIDGAIESAGRYGLRVLLDLHGAPGGQTGTNIDDSPNELPELFMHSRYRDATLQLWSALASRYVGEPVVLGYDLLNEPLPNEWSTKFGPDLVELYKELTRVIRATDPDHLIMYEGAHWATDWSIFTEVWDHNSVLQFHKYWSPPDTASIQRFLDARDGLRLPVYMGEGGENNAEWLYTAFRLYEAHNIGWNFWTWKKVDTLTSPLSARRPDGWDAVARGADGREHPSESVARAALDELLENIVADQCVTNDEVIAAVLGTRPRVIPAWGYGFRGERESYRTSGARPLTGMRSDDAVTIRFREGDGAVATNFEHVDGRPYTRAEQLVVHLRAGDWLEYELRDVDDAGRLRPVDGEGRGVPATVELSERGVVVRALDNLELVAIRTAE